MPRVAWSRLLVAPIALVALALVSCFQDVGKCPTCPAANSGRIEVLVRQNGLVDSVQVTLDGGSQVTVRRDRRGDRRHAYEGLSVGTHDVTITRWFKNIDEVVSSRSSSIQIKLDRGETRTIVFHNDFPLVTWAPMREAGPAIGSLEYGPIAPRVG